MTNFEKITRSTASLSVFITETVERCRQCPAVAFCRGGAYEQIENSMRMAGSHCGLVVMRWLEQEAPV